MTLTIEKLIDALQHLPKDLEIFADGSDDGTTAELIIRFGEEDMGNYEEGIMLLEDLLPAGDMG